MKAQNILRVLLLMVVSQSLVATKFTVENSSSSVIFYNPVWHDEVQGWKKLEQGQVSDKDSSGFGKISAIWWSQGNSNSGEIVQYYLADLDFCDIPVARLGVKIIIKDEGRVAVKFDNKTCFVNGQLTRKPDF